MKSILNKKFLIFGLILTIILVFSLYLFRGSGTVKISVYPPDTKYSLNQKEYQGNSVIELPSGSYRVIFNRNLFRKKIEKIKIKKNQTTSIEVVLVPVDNINDLINNLSDSEAQTIDYSEQLKAQEIRDAYLKKNPIVEVLPIIESKYRIDYINPEFPEVPEVIIEITLFKEYLIGSDKEALKRDALSKIEKYNIQTSRIRWQEKSINDFAD